jgi:hypothetical protein
MREVFIDAFKPFVSDIKKYGLHSLRSGDVTIAVNLGISDRLFKKNGRWRSETAKNGYVNSSEFGEIFAHNKYVSKFVTGHKLLSVRDMATVFQSRYMSVLLLGIKIDT